MHNALYVAVNIEVVTMWTIRTQVITVVMRGGKTDGREIISHVDRTWLHLIEYKRQWRKKSWSFSAAYIHLFKK